MLYEPEASLVDAWLRDGGGIVHVPFGVSGDVWSFSKTARRAGMFARFRRGQTRHIDREAFGYIADGLLTVPQARVGVVWSLLTARGAQTVTQVATALGLTDTGSRRTMAILVDIRAAVIVETARCYALRSIGQRPPHWRDFLKAAEISPCFATVAANPSGINRAIEGRKAA